MIVRDAARSSGPGAGRCVVRRVRRLLRAAARTAPARRQHADGRQPSTRRLERTSRSCSTPTTGDHVPKIPAGSRFKAPLDAFVAGYGQRFEFNRMQITDVQLTANAARRQAARNRTRRSEAAASRARSEGKSDGAAQVGTRSHLPLLPDDARHRHQPGARRRRTTSRSAANKPELSDAQRILAERPRAARRSSSSRSIARRRAATRCSRRFEEALKQAQQRAGHQADARFDLD